MRSRVVFLISVCVLAGCGGGGMSAAKLASAIESKQVATLFAHKTGLVAVDAPACARSKLAGDYTCTGRPTFAPCAKNATSTTPCASKTAPTKVWIACFPAAKGSADAYLCQPENAPAGTHVFVTRAQRAAAKTASWKCILQQGGPNGLDLGPVTISIAKTYGPVETKAEYMTKAAARTLARKLHLPFRSSCE